jgi:hypothetical protein
MNNLIEKVCCRRRKINVVANPMFVPLFVDAVARPGLPVRTWNASPLAL